MVEQPAGHLRKALREAGLSKQAVDTAWPAWWSEEAEVSPSARAELRFALARNLGLSPKALLGERVEFVWRDRSRFKSLTGQTGMELAALNSFGTSVGRLVLQAVPGERQEGMIQASQLRASILAGQPFVSLPALLAACWALSVPVIGLRVFPLQAKSMHAMVVEWNGRHCILLARDASYPAPVAFTLAHELGHIGLGHVGETFSLVDLEEPGMGEAGKDADEVAADAFALSLLTGSTNPEISVNIARFGGRQLAEAVLREGPPRGIEPGTLALCAGFATGNWPAAVAALRYVYDRPGNVLDAINHVAAENLAWDELDDGGAEYLRGVMGVALA